MVADSGAKTGADRLRLLNAPRPVAILVGETAQPVADVRNGRRHRVEEIQDGWRIDDEWWRTPISRRYYRVVLDDGSLRTVFHDLVVDAWYEQAY